MKKLLLLFILGLSLSASGAVRLGFMGLNQFTNACWVNFGNNASLNLTNGGLTYFFYVWRDLGALGVFNAHHLIDKGSDFGGLNFGQFTDAGANMYYNFYTNGVTQQQVFFNDNTPMQYAKVWMPSSVAHKFDGTANVIEYVGPFYPGNTPGRTYAFQTQISVAWIVGNGVGIPAATNSPVLLGASDDVIAQNVNHTSWGGKFNEFAIWKAQLTPRQNEILHKSRLKRMSLQIQPTNLVLYAELTEGHFLQTLTATNLFKDRSGHKNHGTANVNTGTDTVVSGLPETCLSYPPNE